MAKTAYIYCYDEYAGKLIEDEDGYTFIYDDKYLATYKAFPISLTMPLTQKEYKSKTLFPFFDGLIPEGWLLNVAIGNWKLNPKDRFAILLATCKDTIGNISVKDKII